MGGIHATGWSAQQPGRSSQPWAEHEKA